MFALGLQTFIYPDWNQSAPPQTRRLFIMDLRAALISAGSINSPEGNGNRCKEDLAADQQVSRTERTSEAEAAESTSAQLIPVIRVNLLKSRCIHHLHKHTYTVRNRLNHSLCANTYEHHPCVCHATLFPSWGLN